METNKIMPKDPKPHICPYCNFFEEKRELDEYYDLKDLIIYLQDLYDKGVRWTTQTGIFINRYCIKT